MCTLERHLLRHERKHRAVHGNRVGLRLAGVSAADTGTGSVQRFTFALPGATGTHGAYVQVREFPFRSRTVSKADFRPSLIFPQWDMVTVILCVFLLSYMYGEGKV